MTHAQKIKQALAYRGMSAAELARRLETTPQAFNQRMKTDKFSSADLDKIAEILNATWHAEFVMNDTGEKV